MDEFLRTVVARARAWIARALEIGRSRRTRKIGVIVGAVIAVFGVVAYFGVPMVLRHILTGQVAATLNRPVSVGRIAFNPYTLKLDIDKLHIGDRDSSQPFVDVSHVRVKASWKSILRLAPVVSEVTIDRPAIHIVRTAKQRFNFSDLIEQPSPAPTKPSRPGKPLRFAVSNIRLNDGDVRFDDQVLGQHHAVERIQIGVPFIANLRSDVDVVVQPLVQMVIDGSPLRIAGETKPFGPSLDSVLDLKLHRLDLPHYLGYLPPLPVKFRQGELSADVLVHFVKMPSQSVIRLSGAAALDRLDVRDAADSPLLGLRHGVLKLSDVEPLGGVAYIEAIHIDGLHANLVRNRDGTTNLTPLTGGSSTSGGAQPQAASTQPAPPDVWLGSFGLADSAVNLTDNSGTTPAALAINGVHIGLKNFRTKGQTPATFDMGANIGGGGSIAAKGALDMAQSQVTTEISLDQIDLPTLQAFAQSVLACRIAAGKLSAHANVQTHFATGHFNVHAEPASVSLDNFDLRSAGGREKPVSWTRLAVSIAQADLAAHQAMVKEVRADGMHLFVRRERNGKLNLAALIRASGPPPRRGQAGVPRSHPSSLRKPRAVASPPEQPWRYRIESVAVEKTEVRFEDDTTARRVELAVAPLNLHIKGVSSDFAQPFTLDLDGALNRKGSFSVAGTVALTPLKAKLRLNTHRLGLAGLDPYMSGRLNTTISSALLTMNGVLGLASVRDHFRISYRGDATLGNVSVLDKLTGDSFLRWSAFSANGIDFNSGSGPPKVHIGALALADFYARIILNSNGKLNVKDVAAGQESAPTSVTRAEPESAAPAPTPSAPSTGQPIGADIQLGRITLEGGDIDYTDDFIKPNYTANVTDIAGKVGSFGTGSTAPAEVAVQGQINGSAPLDIYGSVNPLAPMAFVDIRAKANGVELTGLTPYSATYAGYPIVKGTLTVDVHYILDQQKLTAENHIFINQLTFGDRVENSTATNLPVRMAVSLLKNSRGEIDLNVPISGSLSDPQFSLGGVILHAFMNLLIKAATSPFSLLSAAFGGGNEDLSYVEFAPGLATLMPESEKRLATLVTALQERTALRLSISGRVDPELDRKGLREAMLASQIKAQKISHVGGGGNIEVSPEEYNKYLTRAYSAATFPKPRNFVGLAKSLPPDEMKRLMLANTDVTDKDLKLLADARANAVRQWLSTKVDSVRLFVIPPKLNANGIKDQGKTTRADLSLE